MAAAHVEALHALASNVGSAELAQDLLASGGLAATVLAGPAVLLARPECWALLGAAVQHMPQVSWRIVPQCCWRCLWVLLCR